MYPQSCRILCLPFRKQITCIVRPSAFVIHNRSYHASSPYVVKSFATDRKPSPTILLSTTSLRQPNFSLLSRYLSNNAPVAGATLSAGPIQQTPEILNDIPAPPVAPAETLTEAIASSSFPVEPTFAELGLGTSWWPSSWVQNLLDLVHTSLDIPWWGCIALGVLAVRICVFPLVIKAQINAARMSNAMPQLTVLNEKMSSARRAGNVLESTQYAFEVQSFMKEKGINPFKNLMVPLVQAPVFMSFFFALKGMANAPVPSMAHGGLFWFTDLTICDPTWLLPLMTSATLWATIELGTDSARLSAQGSQMIMYVLRAMPIVMFPFVINFSSAILCYWLTTNVISLCQVGFLRIPVVRQYFGIPKLDPAVKVKTNSKGFVENAKEAWTNQKITAELEDRQRVIQTTFKRSGTGPIQKTYSYDPTKQKSPTAQSIIQRGFKDTKKST